jgi:DNA-binding NarL/FixJ family response regulator
MDVAAVGRNSGGVIANAVAQPAFATDRPVASRLALVPPPDRIQAPGAAREIRVLIADGEALLRAVVRALLQSEHDITIAGEATTGDEAVALARETHPDVVLIDAQLPGLDAVEATRQIALLPQTRVVILASGGGDSAFSGLRAGASGFLVKDSEPAELVEAVRVVARGDAALSPAVTRRLILRVASEAEVGGPSPDGLEELTDREREVMALAAQGLSNAELAEHLTVRPATAKTHINRAMMKLRARDRAQLVAFAYESGLVTSNRPQLVAV